MRPLTVISHNSRKKVLAATGNISRALEDFTNAVQYQPDADSFQQRGLAYYRMVILYKLNVFNFTEKFQEGCP